MIKKSRTMILSMLTICILMTCSLTMAHISTGSQIINSANTPGGWGGTVYGAYDDFTKQLTITSDIIPGFNGSSIALYYEAFKNGSNIVGTNTALGYIYPSNGTVPVFSTDLSNFGYNISDADLISIAYGGTHYMSRFNYFGQYTYLNISTTDNGNNTTNISTSASNFDLVSSEVNLSPSTLNTHVKLANLSVNGSIPLNNQSVKLVFNGNYPEKDTITDVNGSCYFDLSDVTDNRTGHLEFAGDNSSWINGTVSGDIQFKYNPAPLFTPDPTHIALSVGDINFGGIVHVIATLTDNDSLPLENQTIDFKMGNIKFTNQTCIKGISTWNIPNLLMGMYPVTASFNGTENYSASSASAYFSVFGPIIPDGNDTNSTNGTDTNDTNSSGNGTLTPDGPNFDLEPITDLINRALEPIKGFSLPETSIPLIALFSLLVLAGGTFFKRR